LKLLGGSWQVGILLRRYQRFLADVQLQGGEIVTAHCPNTGAMTNCWQPGDQVYLSDSNDPRRRTRFTLEVVCHRGHRIGIHSRRANDLIADALKRGRLSGFEGYSDIIREHQFLDSRVDFRLAYPEDKAMLMEVKSVTYLKSKGLGLFPDAPSARALKHLSTLMAAKAQGLQAALVFCVQHSGINRVAPALDIDPAYGARLAEAQEQGVMIKAFKVSFRLPYAAISKPVPVCLGHGGLS
jgi:sugar fermentation stimulation protein A